MPSLATMLILTNLAAMVSGIWRNILRVDFAEAMHNSGLCGTLDHFLLLGDNHRLLVAGVIVCTVFHVAAVVCLWRIIVGIRKNRKEVMQTVSLLAFGCAAGLILCMVWNLHNSFKVQQLAALQHRKLTSQITVLHHLVAVTGVQMIFFLLLAVLAYVAQARLKSGLVFTPTLGMPRKVRSGSIDRATTSASIGSVETLNASSSRSDQWTAVSSPTDCDDRRSKQDAPPMDIARVREPVTADLEAQGASDLVGSANV